MVVFIYFAAIVSANLLIAAFGPWFSPINAFVLIGLDLVLRDHLHDKWQGQGFIPRMLGLIIGAGVVSYLLNPASSQIAIASAVAFTAAAMVNMLMYQKFINLPFIKKSNLSNAPAAAVDSVIFPTLAFGILMPEIVLLQFAAKVGGGFFWSLIVNRFRGRLA